ncbi:unnamed protein product [Dracunculus medinensis]|uniref:Midasin n=1 Tax=Dracunculus medinensis TaxID=318479 RepID=A0A0N4UFG6_DRAME|nr:unnamed protein product [Dracunculus medinensis]
MESSVNCEAREVGECDSGCSPHEYSFNGFVVIPERQKFFDQIKIGLHERQFVFVQGAMGCGKTSSIRLIADDLNMQVYIIQMSDQIDSKSLFGSFHCLDVPGDILWKASNFTNAIRKRGIILIKDIDCASADLISTLIDFCENRKQFLTTGEIIHMHDEAFIVATMRLPKEDPAIISVDNEALISSLSFRVVLPAYTDFELIKIIKVKYRRIANYAQKIVEIFNEVANAKIITNRRVSRKLTINDLMRACNRLNNLESMLDNISLLSELLDAWVVHCLKRGEGIAIGQIICKHLSVNYDMVNFLFNVRQPDITFGLGEMVCGRTTIPIFQNFTIKKRQISFGKTREACQLIERVAVCIKHNEAVLLVGETGVGKTSAIQAIASHLNANLRVINLSQQSESSDLIGGYKPVSLLLVLQRLRECFDDLFRKSFNCKKNGKFYEHIDKCLSSNRYEDYVSLILGTANKAIAKFHKVDPNVEKKWADIFVRASRFQKSLKNSALPFAYICGIITEAAKNGDWLLIDEINLAPVECLDAIVHVLDDADKRHPNFRLFACMNPATDVMKKNLPIGIRSRFTEIFVAETIDIEQLMIIASTYLPSLNIKHLLSVLQVHIDLRAKFPGIYSLRTLCRALMFASDNIFGNDERNVFEAVAMSYMTNHSVENQNKVEAIIKSYLKAPEQKLKAAWLQSDFIQVQGYNIRIGTEKPLKDDDFIITPSVSKNLALLARIVCSGRFPVLLEGETSTGKTSMIIHLSKITGNVVFRINNHEHTDLQEYIGSYVPDENGRLVFVEGALLKAMQAGHWVILDELNLAPGDVTEALNRVCIDYS